MTSHPGTIVLIHYIPGTIVLIHYGKEEKIKVALFAFDLLYLNGESLTKKPFRERRELLRKSMIPTDGKMHFAVSSDAADTDEIGRFL